MIKLFSSLFLILGSVLYSFYPLNTRPTSFADGKTLILYDGASGNLPDASLMPFTAFPSDAASLQYSDGATIMDSTLSGKNTYAGWLVSQATIARLPTLDRSAGIQLDFTIQIESELHTSPNRSGFSVIILDEEAKGIELAFWENEIWAQNDDQTGGLFKHGEGADFQTTHLTDYQLSITEDIYTLSANSQLILSGPIRDYSKFDGFPDPYETPNFLFLGDDTTSSQARIRLRFLSVTGTESSVPTVISPISRTPAPTASVTPQSTPTPSGGGFQLCSSGWLLAAMMFALVAISKAIKSAS